MTDGRTPTITVLAGTNGAGKSSVIGAYVRDRGGHFHDPDETARALREHEPGLSVAEANARAWSMGREALEAAIDGGHDFVFETTLGGRTITALLQRAARAGRRVRIWYTGLDGADTHVARVRARVRRGGHDIPEATVRERYVRSLRNLVTLMPDMDELRVFDNTAEAALEDGEAPPLRELLHMKGRRLIALADPITMPAWARPLAAAALRLSTRSRD